MMLVNPIAECDFCNELYTERSFVLHMLAKYDITDRVLAKTPLSYAICGLGAITPGYTLILPIRHCFCLGNLSDEEFVDFIQLKTEIGTWIKNNYGPVLFFEHGATSVNACAGACAEHAHLHALSSHNMTGLRQHLRANFEEHQIINFRQLRDYAYLDQPYLYFENENNETFVYLLKKPIVSQYVRRIWAEQEGRAEEYDWLLFPYIDNMINTINAASNSLLK